MIKLLSSSVFQSSTIGSFINVTILYPKPVLKTNPGNTCLQRPLSNVPSNSWTVNFDLQRCMITIDRFHFIVVSCRGTELKNSSLDKDVCRPNDF